MKRPKRRNRKDKLETEKTRKRQIQKILEQGSGCGSVGRAVESNTRDTRFDSSHRQNFINLFTIKCIERTKKENRGCEWPI